MASEDPSSTGLPEEFRRAAGLDVLPLHSTDLLTLLDETGIVLYESPSIERLYGFGQDELVGQQVTEYFHPEDREQVQSAFATLVGGDDNRVETVEYRHEQANGSYKWIESVGSATPTPNGNYVINSRDISARKQRERELEQTREQAQSERDGKEAIRQLLLQTSTDRDIASSVCRLLVDDYGHEAAWVVQKQGSRRGEMHPVVVADHGSDRGFRQPDDGGRVDGVTARALAANEPEIITVDTERDANIVAQLQRCGLSSVRSVPLEHEGVSYGALTVVRTDTGSDVAGQLVDEVAAALAFKQQVHRQQDALASDTVTELTLRYAGEHALTDLSGALADDEDSPELVVEELQGDGGPITTYLVETADMDAETLRAVATGLASVRGATVVSETETAAVVSLRTDARSIKATLGGHGEVLRSITVRDSRLDLTVEFPRRTDLGAIVDAVQAHWPEADMHACTERPVDDDHPSVFSELTKKQEDALRAASLAGFFERPQRASAEDVAETLGTSASTFLHHLRNAERTVFEDAFSHDTGPD